MIGGGIIGSNAFREIKGAAQLGYGLVLVLILVFPQHVPAWLIQSFTSPVTQILGLLLIYFVMTVFDPVYGLLTAIVIVFLWSIQFQKKPISEPFLDIKPAVIINNMKTRMVPEEKQDQRWFVERLLDEQPYIIEEDLVKTQAVQDDSGRDSANSRVSQ